MRNVRYRTATLLYFFLKKAPLTLGLRQLRADLWNVSRVLPQSDEALFFGPQYGLVGSGGGTRRHSGGLASPRLAPLFKNTLTLMEFLDALRFPQVGDEESIAFLRQLVDDVVHRRVRARDDADGLPLRNQGCDQIKDRLRLARAGRSVNDRNLVGERGSNRVALIDV